MSDISIQATPTATWSKVKSMLCKVTSSTSVIRKRIHSLSTSSSSSSSEENFEEKKEVSQDVQPMVSIPCNVVVKPPTYEEFKRVKLEQIKKEVGEGSYIPGTDYLLGKLLGQGGYGRVYAATRYKKNYAIKVNRHSTEANVENNLKERNTMKRISESQFTEYLVKCGGTLQFGENYCFVMEKMDISLQEILNRTNKPLQLQTVIHLTEQLCEASKALLRIGYVHLDIKPANILFCNVNDAKDPWRIKLCDFGLAYPKQSIRKYDGPAQTIHYRAPEVLLGLPKCDRVDSWSIGCVVFYIYTGFELFTARDELEMIRQIQHVFGLPRGFEKGHQVPYYFKVGENCELVLKSDLTIVPMNYNGKYLNDLEKLGYNFVNKGKSKDLDSAISTLVESLLRPSPQERFTAEDAIEFLAMMKEVCADELV